MPAVGVLLDAQTVGRAHPCIYENTSSMPQIAPQKAIDRMSENEWSKGMPLEWDSPVISGSSRYQSYTRYADINIGRVKGVF